MKTIIACGAIKPELEHVKMDAEDIRIIYLPQNLHRSPDKLKKKLQDAIDQIKSDDGKVILGFGLCSNAVVGVKASSQGLIIPRVHDCIAFYLGNREKYRKIFNRHPGTYYLTKSWIRNKKDPLGLMENEYTQRVGPEMAEEAMRKEIENYKYISFINTAGPNNHVEKLRARARENADFFNKKFIEYKANDDFFRKIVFGPYDNHEFIYIKPNETITQKQFL